MDLADALEAARQIDYVGGDPTVKVKVAHEHDHEINLIDANG